MKGFQFRLARLQRVREVEEQAARERFLAADRTARTAENAVDEARAELEAARAHLLAELEGSIPAIVKHADAERVTTLSIQRTSHDEADEPGPIALTPLTPGRVIATHTVLDQLARRRQSLLERARTLRFQAEAERRAWGDKRRDVRGLERLQDRDRESWVQDHARREAATLDEVASMRAAAVARASASGESPSRSMD